VLHDTHPRSSHLGAPTHRLRGWGSLRLVGSGEVIVSLTGTGTLNVHRLARTDFRFEGTAARRFPSADQLVVTAAHGRMTLRGQDLDLRFSRGRVDVLVRGHFRAEHDGLIEDVSRARAV
jgi:hypothetical protein